MLDTTDHLSICRFRPARLEEIRVVYDMQNVPYREKVFANDLPPFESFESSMAAAITEGNQKLYVLERDNVIVGYSQFFIAEKGCEIVVWGRWLKTLMFASLKVAFDVLGVDGIQSYVRRDNKRVMSAYTHFNGRAVRRELTAIRKGGLLGRIAMVGHVIYQMTCEEFREKEHLFREQSMKVEIISS